MVQITIAATTDELEQIHRLNQQNLKQNLDATVQEEQGFVSWLYPQTLLEQMNRLAPSVIAKDGDQVVGYALTTLTEARAFHPDLDAMFTHLEPVQYRGRPLFSWTFYCMGQICVAAPYRGQGLVKKLYEKHRELYRSQYDFILTEVATRNVRSLHAHTRMGFETIYTYRDAMDEWAVIVWDWNS